MQLRDPGLLRDQAYIAGAWCGGAATFPVADPATGEVLARIPELGAAETRRAIEAANAAWPAWRKQTAKQRAAILRKWFDLILANADDLALLMTREQGKPLAEAKGEIAYGASFVEWFAEEGKRVYGDVIPSPAADRRLVVLKQPIGVCAAITPWNFPNAMITRKVAPALGGLQTDLDGRVLMADGSPLANVYAAGEVAGFGGGGLHGYRALEGTFLGGCIFSGRAAGRAAAKAVR
jgi:succinate-semialdehyde dehydrogenase/glutarate-semialdehyde dehydrogenase